MNSWIVMRLKKALGKKTVRTILIEKLIEASIICLVVIIANRLFTEPLKEFAFIGTSIVVFAFIEAGILKKFYKKELDEYYGWQLLWLHPSNLILIVIVLLVISIAGLIVYTTHSKANNEESIIIGITTGLVASCVIALFSEISNNYRNNLKRLAVLNDYFNVVHFYEVDLGINRKNVEIFAKAGKIQLIDDDKLSKIIKESGESKGYLSKYSPIGLQAIAWEIAEYKDVFRETLINHSDILCLNEIKALNDIITCIESFESIVATSEKTLDEYLYDLSKENDIMVLECVVPILAIFDTNVKILNQYALYINDEESRQMNHLSKRVKRIIDITGQ